MKPSLVHTPAPKARQQGIVLVASLLLLLIVTMLGLSAFRDISVQEKVSSNFRQKTWTFETANSAMQEQWPFIMTVNAGEQVIDVRARDLQANFNYTAADGEVDAIICYDGVNVAPGTDSDFKAYLFNVTTTASQPNGSASQIRQSGYIVAEDTEIVLPTSC